MSGKVLVGLAVAGALLAIALIGRAGISSGPAAPAMNFDVTLADMNGAPVDLASFKGQPLIVNLWATWCGPCRIETPELVKFAEKYKDRGLRVIGISADDTPDAIRAFAAEFGVPYPMLVGLNQEAFLQSIGYRGTLPLTLMVAKDGTIREQITGLRRVAEWERMIEALVD
jgi:thiol-disulfide isomerase/thioredoxin